MVETDNNGMPNGYSIAVVNDIDIEKCSWGEHYLFPDMEAMKKYNVVFNKNWQWGYLQIYLMSNDDYWNEKIKLDKQMDEIQKRIDQLEMCYRTVTIDEDGNLNEIGETYGEKEWLPDQKNRKTYD